MAMVLIAVFALGTLGEIVSLWDTQEDETSQRIMDILDFDGRDPPSGPDGIPSGDPEHL